MKNNCSHKDKNGHSSIRDNVCDICGEEFGKNFINKVRDKSKRNKKRSSKREGVEQ